MRWEWEKEIKKKNTPREEEKKNYGTRVGHLRSPKGKKKEMSQKNAVSACHTGMAWNSKSKNGIPR